MLVYCIGRWFVEAVHRQLRISRRAGIAVLIGVPVLAAAVNRVDGYSSGFIAAFLMSKIAVSVPCLALAPFL